MSLPLANLRVLDFAQGYAAIAGMVFADYGAQVIKVEPLKGEPWRGTPGFRQWNRGKRGVALDLHTDDGRERAVALARSCDVVIESFRPGVMDRLGLGYVRLAASAPHLVCVSISGFGPSGRYAAVKGYEGTVAAKCGQYVIQNGYRDDGPIYDAVPKCSFGASMLGLIGALAALHARTRTGRGQRVDTSLLQANFVYSYTGIRAEHSALAPLLSQVQGRDPHNNMPGYRISQCADGQWIQSGSATGRIFENMMRALGIDEYFQDPPPDNPRLLQLIDAAYRREPLEHWLETLEKHDAAYGTFLSTQDFMDYPQMLHNGHVIEVHDLEVGTTQQVGRLVRFSDCELDEPTSAPLLGAEDPSELLVERDGVGAPRDDEEPPPRLGPLDDLLIIDLSMFAAAPGGPGLLADLGARVIKVEPPSGDPLGANAIGGNELFLRVNRGKERVVLDLKRPEGQEVLHRLVAKADVVVHNFRPGVPDRLGADFATLSAVNDRLVYVYAASFGSTGPDAHRPAFDAVISAMAGGEVLQAGAGNPPQQRQTTDHSALLGVAVAILLGLRARDRSGEPQNLETTMLASAAYLFSDDFIRYEGKPPRPLPDKGQHGLNALYRLYRTADDDWVFLAAPRDDEWTRLCEGIDEPDLATDPRFRTPGDRAVHDAELADHLAHAFARKPARGPTGWEEHLSAVDVACVVATGTWSSLLFDDEESASARRTVTYDHPLLGRVEHTGAAIDLSDTPGRIRDFESFGSSTRTLLDELGYAAERVDEMLASGIALDAKSPERLEE